MQPTFLLINNLLFIKIDLGKVFINQTSAKYAVTGFSGGIVLDEIYTEEEIRKEYPKCKSGDSLLDLKEIWNNKC